MTTAAVRHSSNRLKSEGFLLKARLLTVLQYPDAHPSAMAKVIALASHRTARLQHLDLLRSLVVAGCAMALILAKAPLPF